jgi:stage V sporulation protein G
MKITDVKVFKKEMDKLKGFASITLEGVFVVTGIKIMEGSKGLFVAMPSKKNSKTEKFEDIAYPITKEFREELNKAVLEKYGVPSEDKQDFADAGNEMCSDCGQPLNNCQCLPF